MDGLARTRDELQADGVSRSLEKPVGLDDLTREIGEVLAHERRVPAAPGQPIAST